MEASPLIKAHDHARAAAIATQSADTTVAITEHAQAAGEFATASNSTTSTEALRTLRLLEQHHKRLAELLKLPISPPSQGSIEGDIPEEDELEGPEGDGTKAAQASKEPSSAKQPPPAKPLPPLAHKRYPPGRNLSSSIASNLASARGIRARYNPQPLTPSVSNDLAPGSLEIHPRREASQSKSPDRLEQIRKPSWVPPVIKEDTVEDAPKPESITPPSTDDGFSRFYSTFGSLINRLSAPLAQPHSTTEPDLTKIYSRATLRSLQRDGHASDSFYVVPTSGHTASYASILNHENKEMRRQAASIHRPDDPDDPNDDEDDFVDARESQVPPSSPTFRKRLGRSKSEKDLRNVIEELHLENASLKDVLDKLSKRLHAFELNSQSSHLALAQSLRMQRPGSPLSSSGIDTKLTDIIMLLLIQNLLKSPAPSISKGPGTSRFFSSSKLLFQPFHVMTERHIVNTTPCRWTTRVREVEELLLECGGPRDGQLGVEVAAALANGVLTAGEEEHGSGGLLGGLLGFEAAVLVAVEAVEPWASSPHSSLGGGLLQAKKGFAAALTLSVVGVSLLSYSFAGELLVLDAGNGRRNGRVVLVGETKLRQRELSSGVEDVDGVDVEELGQAVAGLQRGGFSGRWRLAVSRWGK
ncbi:hypothetical protein N0V88_005061 [Collariella sp. IMI 366227]|nr:hypothetical protein N0V88_005061 [Collariella sp. IMI 366227]